MKYKLKFHLKNNIFSSLLMICILIFASKNIFRIYKSSNDYDNYPWPKYYSMGNTNKKTNYNYEIVGTKKIFYPVQGYCMYYNGICSHYGLDKKLKTTKKASYIIFYTE